MALRAKSNNNFMHYLGAYENYYECMSCSSKPELKVTSSLVKLEVVASATDKSLIHIKCSSNSKYLRIFVKHRSVWIGATADTTEEDRTKDACTLFQPLSLTATSADGPTTTLIRLLHVQSGKFLMPFFDEDQDDDLQGIASLGKDDENSRSKRTHFQVYPWEDKKDEEEEKPADEEEEEDKKKKDCADEVERLKKEVEVKKREIKERDEVIKKKEEEIKGKNEEIEEMKTKKKEGGDGEEEEKKKKKKEMEEKDERIKALEAELESLKGKVNKLKHALNILVTYAP
ncbi:hypothetical protein LINGRAHAP2_LOCUS33003 [Linum grandiflorum]